MNFTSPFSFSVRCSAVAFLLCSSILMAQAAKPKSPKPAAAEEKKENSKLQERPNVLFIFTDDHALATISAYGRAIYGGRVMAETPNIDRIANEGALFTHSYCTNSICVPSRAAVLTGAFSHKTGVYGLSSRWNGEQPVFSRMMRDVGYQTALIGKWHLVPNPTNEFEFWQVLTGNGGQGDYYNPDFAASDKQGTFQIIGNSSDIITDKSLEWLDQRDKNRPFLLMTQFKSPHVHRMPAARYLDRYKDHKFPLPATFHDDLKGDRSDYLSHTFMKFSALKEAALNIFPSDESQLSEKHPMKKALARLTPEQRAAFHAGYDAQNEDYYKRKQSGELKGEELENYYYQRYMQDYMRCVAEVDDNIGRILKYLDDNGLSKNTIVIYSSDQGFFNGEHGWTDKRMMYEESFMMPFVVRWPGKIQPGKKIDALIQNIDYAPTFLDIAGVKPPASMQGSSLVPLMTQGKPLKNWRKALYYHYYDDGDYNLPRFEGVSDGHYKLIRYYIPGQREDWDLMDLKKDPNETKSFYRDPAYAKIVKQMHQKLADLRKQYEVPEREPTKQEIRSIYSGYKFPIPGTPQPQ